MKKVLIYAGAVLAVAVTSAPAHAVPATSNAQGRVRVLRPLQIQGTRDLNLQTIVLSGTAPFSATVGVAQDGTPSCPAAVTCSGTMTSASYEIRGAANQDVTITVANTLALANQTDNTAPDLTLTVDAPPSVNLGANGNSGYTFYIGGSVTVDDTTADGLYEGTFTVSADYQ